MTTSDKELATNTGGVSPFVAALRSNQGAPASEPEPQPEVAEPTDVAGVADDAPQATEQVAKKDNGKASLPDLSDVPGFREWQSSMDKQLTELRRERDEAVQAKAATPTGPDPELVSERESLVRQWQSTMEAGNAATSNDEVIAFSVQADRLLQKITDMDFTMRAKQYGFDTSNKELRKYIDTQIEVGRITGPETMDDAFKIWAYDQGTMPDASSSLSERQKALDAREQSIEALIKAEVDRQVAQALQESGATSIPTVKPAGNKSQAQQLEDAFNNARSNGNMREALRLQRLIANTES